MSDNVNIIVQDTINDIVVNTAVVVETIDINVQVAVDEVNIIANPNNYVVNINRIIGEQVQSDWNQNNNQEPDYIKNKPSIPILTSDLTNDGEDGVNPFITANDVTPQVNSDWNATSGVAQILNKPTIPSIAGLATVVYVDQQDALKVDKVTGYSLTKNDLTDALKSTYDNTVSSLTTLLASGLRLITSAEIIKLNNTSGVNTGDETTATIKSKLGVSNTSQDGYLTAIDWNAFKGKFNLPSLTSGSVLFSNGTTIAQDNSNFFWDDTNKRLGIGTASPNYKLDVNGTVRLGITTFSNGITLDTDSGSRILSGLNIKYQSNNATLQHRFTNQIGASLTGTLFQIDTGGALLTNPVNLIKVQNQSIDILYLKASGNLLLGTATDNGAKLQIKAQGALSTDIALRVRNSADTADLLYVKGDNVVGVGKLIPDQILFNGGTQEVGVNGISNLTRYYSSGLVGQKIQSQTGYNLLLSPGTVAGQTVVIESTVGVGITINNSAILQANSTTQGFLPPRMTTTQKNAIATPATGLVVFDITLLSLFQYNGSAWVDLKTSISLNTSGFGENVSYNSTTNQLIIDKYSWMDLARGYTVEPTLFTATSTYEVYTYVYSSSTLYRKIMNDGSLDGFYSESGLINLLCTKKIIL